MQPFTGYRLLAARAYVDLPRFIDGLEMLRRGPHGFRFPQKQVAVRVQGKRKCIQDHALQFWIEVDQHIPAHHEVHAWERTIATQVVLPESNHLAQPPRYPEAAFHWLKEPFAVIVGDVLQQ